MPPLTELAPDTLGLVRRGLPIYVKGTSPAAGADFVQAVDGADFVRLVSVFCRLVTDATVAAREVVVEYRSGEDERFALFGAPVTVSASDTVEYAFHVAQPRAEWEVDSSILVPLGGPLLIPGQDFRLHVVNVQATDQLSRVRFVWELFDTDVDV